MGHSVDVNDDVIMTDILVIAYIKNQMKAYSLTIPMDIQQLCYIFWQYIACDSWSTDFNDENKFQINGDSIKTLEYGGITFYGNHIVKNGKKYVWKLKLIAFPYHTFNKFYNPYIGVIYNDDKILHKYSNGDRCKEWRNSYGYSFIGGSQQVAYSFEVYGDKFNDINDTIWIHLDLVNYTISYTINGTFYGVANENIAKKDYRLAVTFRNSKKGSEIQLL